MQVEVDEILVRHARVRMIEEREPGVVVLVAGGERRVAGLKLREGELLGARPDAVRDVEGEVVDVVVERDPLSHLVGATEHVGVVLAGVVLARHAELVPE